MNVLGIEIGPGRSANQRKWNSKLILLFKDRVKTLGGQCLLWKMKMEK